MRGKIWTAAIAATVVVLSAASAEACSRAVPAKAVKTQVPAKGIDQDLLEAAIRVEVNYHRCRVGLSELGDAGNGLARQAHAHSKWMAKTGQLAHKSTVAGRATLMQRIKKSGVRFRTGSENIGMVHRYQVDNRRFRIIDANSCAFVSTKGEPLPAHSYATLARHIVTLWMESPGHRKNILDRNAKAVSSAIAFEPKADFCGRFWITQNFIG
ncbi:hypothetical protein GQ651_10565 [Alphaproteobacteria bacterium GH1-50]|uniref:SCP domain-containing protein n=1 Tax=Kangsaoukella pontilimi TaxID=2691042 RepID=A0A7C9IS52_9RHOB|nr:CAP domain-containing protein [Kangsaoukella pontilimi]MXQ08286.1 hypothetical protein [Kangsaoukella pontilimi]